MDFAGPGLYPTYILTTILKLAAMPMNPFPIITPNMSMNLILLFGSWST